MLCELQVSEQRYRAVQGLGEREISEVAEFLRRP
jgi:hypothetical protein